MSLRLPGRGHPPVPPFGLTGVHVRGFRSLKDTSFRPTPLAEVVERAMALAGRPP